MPDLEFDLIHGYKVGGEVLKHIVIKDHLIAGEIFDAQEESEKIMMVETGEIRNGVKVTEPEILISPSLMGKHTLRRQIKSLGNIDGPISLAVLNKLHQQDLKLIDSMCNKLENLKVSRAVAQTGRSDTDSGGTG